MKNFIEKILKSFLAGVCISIGAIVYLSVENKVFGAILFSTGLLSILQYGLYLYTGKIGIVKNKDDLLNCIIYFISNVLGCLFVWFIINISNSVIKHEIYTVSLNKISKPLYAVFFLSIMCGVLMLFATKYKENHILTMFCVATFILCGFEHSIADAFYLLGGIGAYGMLTYIKYILIIALGNGVGALLTNKIIESEK